MSSEWAGVVGSAVGAVAVLLSQLASSWWQAEIARRQWERQKISEVYENALDAFYRKDNVGNADHGFLQKSLRVLLIHSTWMNHTDLEKLAENVRSGSVQPDDVARIALTDPRLVGREKRSLSDARGLLPPSK